MSGWTDVLTSARLLRCGVLAAPSAVLLSLSLQSLPVQPAVHDVRLSGNRFTPSEIRAAPGDTIRFTNGMGGPHNIQFMAESISVAAQGLLNNAMKDKILPLTSPMFLTEGEKYELIVPKLPAGRYPFLCSPHWSNMRGAIVISE
jgi:plastocyanin